MNRFKIGGLYENGLNHCAVRGIKPLETCCDRKTIEMETRYNNATFADVHIKSLFVPSPFLKEFVPQWCHSHRLPGVKGAKLAMLSVWEGHTLPPLSITVILADRKRLWVRVCGREPVAFFFCATWTAVPEDVKAGFRRLRGQLDFTPLGCWLFSSRSIKCFTYLRNGKRKKERKKLQ